MIISIEYSYMGRKGVAEQPDGQQFVYPHVAGHSLPSLLWV